MRVLSILSDDRIFGTLFLGRAGRRGNVGRRRHFGHFAHLFDVRLGALHLLPADRYHGHALLAVGNDHAQLVLGRG